MRIVVPIKQVPETSAVRMDEATGTMVRDGVEAIINPLDLYGLEVAIRLREAAPDADSEPVEVVAISMGPPKADKALREAIAMGCDRGVLISHKAFAGSDTWATSYVLAAAIKKLAPVDLVICGERATDGDTGQVGPGIAAFCRVPVVTYVSALKSIDGRQAVMERLVEDGREVLRMQLPGVITVVKEIGSPRLPTLRGKIHARHSEIPCWGPEQLDLEPGKLGLGGSPTRVVKIHRPTVARKGQLLVVSDDASAEAAADKVVEILIDKQLI
jgi:electron transfer flavoprotein beta subunit